jgi:two-component system, NarL family, sensor kinase
MQETSHDLTTLLLITTFLIILMAGFILLMIFIHKKKQISHIEKINEIQANYEKSILKSQLEMQEETFEHISREIHDNISLALTLAKLNLNTLNLDDKMSSKTKIDSSIELLTQSITQLRDLSKSLDSDLIEKNGLLSAIKDELQRIRKSDKFKINYMITGTPVYMNCGDELIIFRIIQEAFNNIIKHAKAKNIGLKFHFSEDFLKIRIADDGVGFKTSESFNKQAGLKNMKTRIALVGGEMEINSNIGEGTILDLKIPFNRNN